MQHVFTEPCILVQDDQLSEPLVLLRRYDGAEVEVLTIQKAHELLELVRPMHPVEEWFNALETLLEGIR